MARLTVRRLAGGGVARLPAQYASAHVELGYATTAHRAQGRTVDTTHAFVTVDDDARAALCHGHRGRESNRLYVDTMYDPDAATSHDGAVAVDPVVVLEQVLAHTAADLSASEMRDRETANSLSPARAEAEGAAIAAVHRARRAQIRYEAQPLHREV